MTLFNLTISKECNKHFLGKKKNAKKIAIFLYAPNKDALLAKKKVLPLSFMHEKKGSHAINSGQGQASICSCDFCQAKTVKEDDTIAITIICSHVVRDCTCTLASTKLLCMKNAGTQWTMNFS